MQNIKKICTFILLNFSTFLMLDASVLKFTNKSSSSIRVYVGYRKDSANDANYAVWALTKVFNTIANARASNAPIIKSGDVGTISYGSGPRGIIVDFLDANGAVTSTIAFPFGETNSEIYILGGLDPKLGTIAQSVAYFNNDAIKAKFPNGLVGDANGNLTADQLALLTPASTDPKSWDYNNRDHTGLMVCMYSKDLAPKVQ